MNLYIFQFQSDDSDLNDMVWVQPAQTFMIAKHRVTRKAAIGDYGDNPTMGQIQETAIELRESFIEAQVFNTETGEPSQTINNWN